MGNAIRRKRVTNTGYQQWDGYPQSPVNSTAYPYQVIIRTPPSFGADAVLIVSSHKIWRDSGNQFYSVSPIADYYLYGGSWVPIGTGPSPFYYGPTAYATQSNNDVYSNASFTIVYLSKTTSYSQDAGEVVVWERVRNLRESTSVSYPAQAWTGYPETPYSLHLLYPHQVITNAGQLILSPNPIYKKSTNYIGSAPYGAMQVYKISLSGEWVFEGTIIEYYTTSPSVISECNHMIPLDDFTTVYKSKTTTTEQDANEASVSSEVMARGVFRKDETEFARINL